jgi:predicted enzyme related to lactoylglutathione lyase
MNGMIEQNTGLRGLDVVFYAVKDMPRARAFYEGLFGIKPSMESEYWVEYDLPDGTTFALANDPNGWKEGHGLMLGVTDRAKTAERAKQLGGTITDRQFESQSCGAFECIDPEGNYLYFHQRK